ncbi:hypothetical protein NQ315_008599 [Exocentrus adspersus]|uniref:Uncharacterized protein n=1 Tax=Exocentrus adspersus TaxID=1586481 RepID=A0AAV8W7F7_9CUCU|nr:hypothetical protein NQ315_008599 [Exocentrus adspersus]
MAAAASEGSPTTPLTPSTSSLTSERTISRSPSLGSAKDFQWPSLLVSKPGKRRQLKKCKVYGLVRY